MRNYDHEIINDDDDDDDNEQEVNLPIKLNLALMD